MESSNSLSIKDKEFIKELVQDVYSLRYINIEAIYEDIEGILSNMSKEELLILLKSFYDASTEDFGAYYDNPVREIRRIILANMFVQKDLSEMEREIDEKILDWLYKWTKE
jgi:hypothetical protein